jgi:hypothetical protein
MKFLFMYFFAHLLHLFSLIYNHGAYIRPVNTRIVENVMEILAILFTNSNNIQLAFPDELPI